MQIIATNIAIWHIRQKGFSRAFERAVAAAGHSALSGADIPNVLEGHETAKGRSFTAHRAARDRSAFYKTERSHSALERRKLGEAPAGKRRETGGMKRNPDTP